MSKVTTLQLVRDLTLFTPEEGTIERYYREAVQEIHPFFYNISLLQVSLDQATFTLPDEAEKLMQVFYDARMLDMSTISQIRAVDIQWRDRKGDPLIYLTENETERTWRIAPIPDTIGNPPLGFGFLGVNFPSYNVLALYTVDNEEAPDLFDLPIAFRILEREFSRESSHQDIEYSTRCRLIYLILMAMLSRV